MGDFGWLIRPTSLDTFLDAFEDDRPCARRLSSVARFFVLEIAARELRVTVFFLFLLTIPRSWLFPFFPKSYGSAFAPPAEPHPTPLWLLATRAYCKC
jgi:hypothetical protein